MERDELFYNSGANHLKIFLLSEGYYAMMCVKEFSKL